MEETGEQLSWDERALKLRDGSAIAGGGKLVAGLGGAAMIGGGLEAVAASPTVAGSIPGYFAVGVGFGQIVAGETVVHHGMQHIIEGMTGRKCRYDVTPQLTKGFHAIKGGIKNMPEK